MARLAYYLQAFAAQVITAYVTGAAALLIASLNEAEASFQLHCATTNTFMQRRKLPETIQKRVHNYLDCRCEGRPGQ